MPTVAAFCDRVAAAFPIGDADAYAALFDFPCIFFTDTGFDYRASPAEAAARAPLIRAAAEAVGAARMGLRVLAQRTFGASLTTVRVETWLEFRGGGESDAYAELWVLRQSPRGLRLAAVMNPISAWLLDLPPSAPRPAAPGPGLRLRPNEAGTDRGVHRLVDAMTDSFNAGDEAAQIALMDLPQAKITDERTDVMTDPDRLGRRVESVFGALERHGPLRLVQTPMFVRPFGACLQIARVEVTATLPDGRAATPVQELWILRTADDALRIAAFVNPFAPSFVPEPDA